MAHGIPADLTAARLREMLNYDAATGVFTWRVKRNRNTVLGSVAGRLESRGYWWIRIDGKGLMGHHLAWLYVTGQRPPSDIDHKNGNRADNSWQNLRAASRLVNAQNRFQPNPKNTTGLIGVSRDRDRFRASITVNRRRVGLGTFDTPEAAHAAYLVAKRQYHPEARHYE